MDTQKSYKVEGLLGAVFTHLFVLLLLLVVIWGGSSTVVNSKNRGSGPEGLEIILGNDINGSGRQQSENTHQSQEPAKVSQTVSQAPQELIRSNEVGNEITVQDVKAQEPGQQQVYARAIYSGTTGNGDTNESGNFGKPDGSPDGNSLYDGGTSSLDMAGWIWDRKPVVDDRTEESGRIKFKIKINADGEVESVTAVEKSVSPSLVRLYLEEVQKLSFSRSNGRPVNEGASGYITFVIHSR